MKRFPSFVLLAAIWLGACSNIPGLAQPTSTPLPTNTPSPTFTPLPTDTPTQTPTATPDPAATATQVASEILSDLETRLGDTNIPYEDGHLAWKQTREFEISMSGPSQEILKIDEDLTAKNFIFKSDVTWEATGLLLCGAVFRSEPDLQKGKQYQFMFMRFSGLPAWAIEVHEYGLFKNSPTKAKFSDVLDLGNGKTNQFILIVEDDHFTLYLNKMRQGTYYDYSIQRSEGSFAFLGLQQSGEGSCKFEDSWIWVLE